MTVLNVLVENSNFGRASVEDAAAWHQRYGLDFDVLADVDGSWAAAWGNTHSEQYSQHAYTLLDERGVVLWRLEENQTFDNAVLGLIIEELERL